MDLSMPEVGGIAATKLISAELPDVKVVILTASEDDTSLFEAISQGLRVPGQISKPKTSFDPRTRQQWRAGVHSNAARKLLVEFAKPSATEATRRDRDALTAREREVSR